MICPDCNAEYRPGFERCADCGTVLVHDVAPAADPPADDDGSWVKLCTLNSETKARLIQGFLESEGVPCSFESLVFHAEPVTFGPLSRVHLYVLEGDLERARETLERADQGSA